jgi:hypothetical protein
VYGLSVEVLATAGFALSIVDERKDVRYFSNFAVIESNHLHF